MLLILDIKYIKDLMMPMTYPVFIVYGKNCIIITSDLYKIKTMADKMLNANLMLNNT